MTTKNNRRILTLPATYQPRLEAELQRLNHSLQSPRRLAEAVLKLSNHYTENPDAPSPWRESWAQVASLVYYFPLNYVRNRAVAQEGLRLGFFSDLDTQIDFGSGMGTTLHALSDAHSAAAAPLFQKRIALDVSSEALRLGLALTAPDVAPYETRMRSHHPSKTLLTASYVLTELEEPPASWMENEALMILEPSTQDDGRRLQNYRSTLIENGFHIWAPCTHQGACPMLLHSARDWCHDRVHFEAPSWFAEMEKHLPMKNRTITFSYLLARKSKAPPAQLASLARLTGDQLDEKGKTRQSICRGSEREFLAWFPQRMKRQEEIHMQRGSLVQIRSELEKKSFELRLQSSSDVYEIPSEDSLLSALSDNVSE